MFHQLPHKKLRNREVVRPVTPPHSGGHSIRAWRHSAPHAVKPKCFSWLGNKYEAHTTAVPAFSIDHYEVTNSWDGSRRL